LSPSPHKAILCRLRRILHLSAPPGQVSIYTSEYHTMGYGQPISLGSMRRARGGKGPHSCRAPPEVQNSVPEVSFWCVVAGQSEMIVHPQSAPVTPEKTFILEKSADQRISENFEFLASARRRRSFGRAAARHTTTTRPRGRLRAFSTFFLFSRLQFYPTFFAFY